MDHRHGLFLIPIINLDNELYWLKKHCILPLVAMCCWDIRGLWEKKYYLKDNAENINIPNRKTTLFLQVILNFDVL